MWPLLRRKDIESRTLNIMKTKFFPLKWIPSACLSVIALSISTKETSAQPAERGNRFSHHSDVLAHATGLTVQSTLDHQ